MQLGRLLVNLMLTVLELQATAMPHALLPGRGSRATLVRRRDSSKVKRHLHFLPLRSFNDDDLVPSFSDEDVRDVLQLSGMGPVWPTKDVLMEASIIVQQGDDGPRLVINGLPYQMITESYHSETEIVFEKINFPRRLECNNSIENLKIYIKEPEEIAAFTTPASVDGNASDCLMVCSVQIASNDTGTDSDLIQTTIVIVTLFFIAFVFLMILLLTVCVVKLRRDFSDFKNQYNPQMGKNLVTEIKTSVPQSQNTNKKSNPSLLMENTMPSNHRRAVNEDQDLVCHGDSCLETPPTVSPTINAPSYTYYYTEVCAPPARGTQSEECHRLGRSCSFLRPIDYLDPPKRLSSIQPGDIWDEESTAFGQKTPVKMNKVNSRHKMEAPEDQDPPKMTENEFREVLHLFPKLGPSKLKTFQKVIANFPNEKSAKSTDSLKKLYSTSTHQHRLKSLVKPSSTTGSRLIE